MANLWPFIRLFSRHLRWMLLGGLLTVMVLVGAIGLIALSGWFIAASALAGAGILVGFEVFRPSAGIRFFALLRTGARYGERLATHEATFRMLADLRVWFFEKAIPLAPAGLGRYRGGDLLNRITADIDALDNLYLRVLAPTVIAVLMVVAIGVLASLIDPVIALIAVAALLVAGFLVPALSHLLGADTGRDMVARSSELRGRIVETLQGMAEVKVFQAEGRQAAMVAGDSDALFAHQRRMARITGLGTALSGLTMNLTVWLVLFFGLDFLRQGLIDGPMVALVTLAAMAVFETVAPLPTAWQYLGRTRAAAGRLIEIARTAPPVPEPPHPAPLPADDTLTVEGVTFAYGPDAPPALSDISFTLPASGRLAVVGASGAGKSTLTALLLRFWAPAAGTIRLGGVDTADLAGDDLRRRFAVLDQRPHLFRATLRDNLLLARPEADEAALWDALAVARLDAVVRDLPDGLDTWLGEAGVGLSGGQARRLALARAVLKDAPILLLDEPTAGLDAENEAAVLAGLGRLMAGRSVLLITHAVTGVQDMDQVLVLDRGRVVEAGAPDALAAGDGPFRRLLDARTGRLPA